jgi:hypothetical protein
MHMTRFALIASAIAATTILAGGGPALAQSNRTFVSGLGSDTGGCAITAPCRTFAYAITVTNAGGEIVVLTSAGYGTVTINKAISITNEEGVEAAITVTSGDGITVAAGTSDVVNLRGLTLIGQGGSGSSGIVFTSGGTLNIQNTVITGFTNGSGLNLIPSGSGVFNISDTIVADNFSGLEVFPTGSGATVKGFFKRVQALGNSSAGFLVTGTLAASSTIQVTAADCVASGSLGGGFEVSGAVNTAQPTFTVVNSKSVNNNYGLGANSATMIVAQTTTFGNADGYIISGGGTLNSFGNNYITETSHQGTLTPISQQ